MFRPDSNRDRTDYSGILMPPDGYRLDRAVGTTYSLDLEALTAVAICLGLSEETDSKLMQNPIGMLNALQKVSDKIVLFCEAGQIKVPTKPTALSILLEKMVVEVALPKDRQLGRYPAFHPKTWILAYVNAEGDKKYRFVVMSRNLTFDRSWDISFAMDSSKNVRQKKKTQPICDFLDYLVTNVHNTSNNAGKKRNLIRGLCADIKDVSFSLDSKIFGEDFEVLPLGTGKGKIAVKPDKIRLYVNKEELCKEYEDTLRRSTEDTELLKDLFEKLGFQRKDLKTVYFNVDTEYESYQDRDKSWKRRFKGYKYNHHMKIEFAADNKRLGQVLYALAHSSLRPEFSIEYTVADVEKCKNELLHKAIEDSIQKAQVFTTAANVKLGEIQAIDYSWGEIDFVTKPLNEMRLMECTECEMSAPGAYDIDIEADDINVIDTASSHIFCL